MLQQMANRQRTSTVTGTSIPEARTRKEKIMKPQVLTAILLIGSLIALVGCGSKATPSPESVTASIEVVLKISGSGSTTPILEAIRPAFEADTPGYRLEVLPGTGTGGGVKGVIESTLDVAAMARPPKEEEADQGIQYVEFGRSGVALYTHPGVNVTSLTTAQVMQICTGEVTNWSQAGGPDLDIILYVRDEGDSSTLALRQAFFGDTQFPQTAQVLTSQEEMQSAVAGTPGGVGFGSWASAVASDVDVSCISLDAVSPDSSSYAMLTTLGIGYRADRQADVQPLIDWLLSDRGREALSKFAVVTTS
jgi:phosphate transport system substrate-binding protein